MKALNVVLTLCILALFWEVRAQRTSLADVQSRLSGYQREAFPVMKSTDLYVNPPAPAFNDLYVRGNSGIVVGYAIGHILESIKAQSRKPVP